MFFSLVAGSVFLLSADIVNGRSPSNLQKSVAPAVVDAAKGGPSMNVSSCPGYVLSGYQDTVSGFTARLGLAGPSCNAFGTDIANLTIQVTYETSSRLHVNIFDTANQQFRIPKTVIDRPAVPTVSAVNQSDLEFNYNPSPFEFWITRKSDAGGDPIFDTRASSLPKTPIAPVIKNDSSTALDGFPLVFEDQYLQLTSALPKGTNIYGLGEVLASSGFRRDIGTDGGVGTVQAFWARDVGDPIDENVYGSHPIYVEQRYDIDSDTSSSHGVLFLSAAAADVLLLTPPNSGVSLVEYRAIGGVLDFYFFSGPGPKDVIEQYGELIGFPVWQPAWAFGFHLCRWGYKSVNDTKQQVQNMKDANIPLEVMWNDIDLYQAFRDFTADPVSFPGNEMREFIADLKSNNQRYIPIVDAAIAVTVNSSDVYDIYTDGVDQNVFITNPGGSMYVGQVWPGYTVFPDWFAKNTQSWWENALRTWCSTVGVTFSGIWLDMNEASSFCDGSCGTGANLSNTTVPFFLPGTPGNPVSDWPEGYDPKVSGPSGNMTVNGTRTFGATSNSKSKRGVGAGAQNVTNINTPPYAIHNGYDRLSTHALATNATHAHGYAELDVHNLWGLMEEQATYQAVANILQGERPFLISRSTFPSAGKFTGHWLGDNFSKWQWMYLSIQGILQFQIFQIPMVGADTCGFNGNTDEELCNRWMQLSAFTPFFRNHNVLGAIPQEPYRWDSVANASRIAIGIRYALLPYWYSLFANASMQGTPPVRALWFEFPNEPELFVVDRQFMIGDSILVTPVLTPNVTSVNGIFPGRGSVIWRDWYTHNVVKANNGTNTTLSAPLSHINIHIRGGSALLLHQSPAYTISDTRSGPYELLVSLDANGGASGWTFVDDGISNPPGPSKSVSISAGSGKVILQPQGEYWIGQKLVGVTVMGVMTNPSSVIVNGAQLPPTNGPPPPGTDGANGRWTWNETVNELSVNGMSVDLNQWNQVSWV